MADGTITINSKLDNKEFITDSKQLLSAIKSLQSTASGMGKGMASSARSFTSAMQQGIASSRQLKSEISSLTAKAAQMRNELNRRGEASGAKQFMDLREQIKNTEKQFDAALEKQNKIADAKGVNSAAFQKAASEVEQLGNKLESLRAKMSQTQVSQADIVGYKQQQDAIKNVETELGNLRDMQSSTGGIGAAFANVAQSAARATASIAKMAGGAAISFLRKLASGAANAAAQLAKLAANAVRVAASQIKTGFATMGKAMAGAAKSLLGFNRTHKSTHSGLAMGLKNIMRYAFGIRSLFFLFRRLRQAVSEGFGELKKQNPEVKAALDSLSQSLSALRGSLAVAFAPILTAIAPALNALISMITAAINAIGALFAALSGRGVVARSIGKIGKAAGGAAGGAAKLNKELAKFDELNILKDKGGGGGGGGGGSGLAYEEVPIEGSIKEFADKIRALWEAEDYTGIGNVIAEYINKAFDHAANAITWENIEDKVSQGVEIVAGIFNGLVDPEKGIDFEHIGNTVGQGVRSLIKTLNLLLISAQIANVGIGIARFFNGIIDLIDPEELGELLVNAAETALNYLTNFVSTFEWGTAGTKFAQTVNKIVGKPNWRDIGHKISELIHGPIRIIKAAVSNFEWGSAGTAFAETINGFFENPNLLSDGIDAFNSAVTGMLEFANNALSEFRPDVAAGRIRDALKKIKWGEIASGAWELLKTAIRQTGNFLYILFGGDAGVDPATIDDAATDINEAINEKLAIKKFGNEEDVNITTLAATILRAIKDAFAAIPWGEWGTRIRTFIENDIPWNSIFDTILESLKTAAAGLIDFFASMLGFNTGNGGGKSNGGALGTIIGVVGGAKLGGMAIKDIGKLLGFGGNSGLSGFAKTLSLLSAKVNLFIAGVGLMAGAAVFAGNKIYDAIKEKIEPILQETAPAVAEAIEERIPDEGKVYEGTTGDAVGDFLMWITKGKSKYEESVSDYNEQRQSEAEFSRFNDEWGEFVRQNEIVAQALEETKKDEQERFNKNWENFIASQGPEFANFGELAGYLSTAAFESIANKIKDLLFPGKEWSDFYGETEPQREEFDYDAWANAIEDAWGGYEPEPVEEQGLLQSIGDAVTGAFQSIGDFLFPKASAEGGEGYYNEENMEALQRDTKATNKLEKTVKKDTKTKKGLDIDYEGSGLGILEEDDPYVPVRVGFVPSGEDEPPEEGGGGLLGWLQSLLAPGVSILAYLLSGNTPADIWDSIVDFFAKLVGADSGSLSFARIFGTFFDVLAKLIGGDSGSLSFSSIFGTFFSILAKLTGKDGGSLSFSSIFGTFFIVAAKLIGKAAGSLSFASIFGTFFNILAKLVGKESKGLSFASIFGTFFGILAKLTGGDPNSKSPTDIFGEIVKFAAWLVSDGANWKKYGDTPDGWFHQILGNSGMIVSFIAGLVSNGSNWKKYGKTPAGWFYKVGSQVVTFIGNLTKKGTNWGSGLVQWITGNASGIITATLKLVVSGAKWLISLLSGGSKSGSTGSTSGGASGGIVRKSGIKKFASGGSIMSTGRASWWDSVNKYAAGTAKAHGTVFVAGEAGPEILGHVNGRTEILNKSQLGQIMFSSVENGMIAAMSRVRFRMPDVASGGIMPYDVSAQIARSTTALQTTLDTNNEDLIQAMVSAIGNAAMTIVNAVQKQQGGVRGGLTTRQVINEINQMTLMYGKSPLKGV